MCGFSRHRGWTEPRLPRFRSDRVRSAGLSGTRPLPGSTATAGAFNGTSSYLQLPASLASNASYLAGGNLSVWLWFKTTTDNDVLFSYETSPISAGLPRRIMFRPCMPTVTAS